MQPPKGRRFVLEDSIIIMYYISIYIVQCHIAYIINNKLHCLAHLKKNNTLVVEVNESVGITKVSGKMCRLCTGHTLISNM